jgi:predicted Zn-dependent protease
VALVHARIVNLSVDGSSIEVMFNPTDYSIDRGAHYAELAVPGLETPILQFVRGEADTLSLELFLDGSTGRGKVEEKLRDLRALVKVNDELHAPPVCAFDWGGERFVGVVTSLKEKYTLFDENGTIQRARVTLSLKSYRTVAVQQREQKRQSPDRTRVRVLREGETLAMIANEAYGDPRLWRVIAEANDVDRPRFVAPGTPLRIPAI